MFRLWHSTHLEPANWTSIERSMVLGTCPRNSEGLELMPESRFHLQLNTPTQTCVFAAMAEKAVKLQTKYCNRHSHGELRFHANASMYPLLNEQYLMFLVLQGSFQKGCIPKSYDFKVAKFVPHFGTQKAYSKGKTDLIASAFSLRKGGNPEGLFDFGVEKHPPQDGL